MTERSLAERARYFGWAAINYPFANTTCPVCRSKESSPVKRKALVTVLYRCHRCSALFRVPKDKVASTQDFYQSDYSEGFVTDCPSAEELDKLKAADFAGTEMAYASRIAILDAAGIRRTSSLLDYGCSWGYGSWQFSQAGFNVYSYEISRARANYAEQMLRCQIVRRLEDCPPVDCLFSSHVIEHMPDPTGLWRDAARVVRPGGHAVVITPNGEHVRMQVDPRFHRFWGRVHPLVFTAQSMCLVAKSYGFEGRCYSTVYGDAYDLEPIREASGGPLGESELLFIGVKLDPSE